MTTFVSKFGFCLFLGSFIVAMPSFLLAENPKKSTGDLIVKVISQNAPKPSVMRVPLDVKVCGTERSPQSVRTQSDGALADVVVWIEPVTAGIILPPAPENSAQLTIQHCEISPRVAIISPGSGVEIRSNDSILFHLRSSGKKNQKKAFPLPPNLKKVTFTFEEPEIDSLLCDLHPWMRAYVVVAPHAFWKSSDERGVARLSGIPPGSYTVHLWHEMMGSFVSAPITITAQKTMNLPLVWDFLAEPAESSSR